MARFCVYRLRESQEYVIDLQADFLRDLQTRIVAPLLEETQIDSIIGRLSPKFLIDGRPYFAAIQLIAAVSLSEIGELVADASDRSDELTASIDFAFQGF